MVPPRHWTDPGFIVRIVTIQDKVQRRTMAYEYPTPAGVLRLLRVQRHWAVQFKGRRSGDWRSPDAAAVAVARHRSGLVEWDRQRSDVSGDLLDWRPLGESL
jgi:hypothetical protein